MNDKKNISLFSRASIIIGMTLFLFQMTLVTSIIIFLIMPVIKSSAVTMASIIEVSSQYYLKIPTQEHKKFNQELKKRYNFQLYVNSHPDIDSSIRPHEPYLFYLEDQLSQQFNQILYFYGDNKNPNLYWIKYYYQEKLFELAVPLHQPGGQPHAVIWATIISGLIILLSSSWFLAYHLNKPINLLINNIRQVSYGISPKPIPENGCRELVVLAHSVNNMVLKVNDLIENRTVMLGGISHDLRTPLTRMALSVELFPKEVKPQLVEHIRQDVYLMNEMISHYMELASCLTKEKPEQLDLHALIHTYIKQVQQYSTVDISLQMPIIRSDTTQKRWVYPVALKRIISNLLENAIRYGEGKPVSVSCEKIIRKQNTYAVIKIMDQGSGIPEQELKKVFNPFYRVDKSRNTQSGGSGLGLAIVHHLTQAHDWVIELESPPNQGLTAKLILPFY